MLEKQLRKDIEIAQEKQIRNESAYEGSIDNNA